MVTTAKTSFQTPLRPLGKHPAPEAQSTGSRIPLYLHHHPESRCAERETKAYPGSLAWVPNICSSLKGFLTHPCKADLTGPALPLLALAVLNPTLSQQSTRLQEQGHCPAHAPGLRPLSQSCCWLPLCSFNGCELSSLKGLQSLEDHGDGFPEAAWLRSPEKAQVSEVPSTC